MGTGGKWREKKIGAPLGTPKKKLQKSVDKRCILCYYHLARVIKVISTIVDEEMPCMSTVRSVPTQRTVCELKCLYRRKC